MRFGSDFSRLPGVPSVAFAGLVLLATASACSDSSGLSDSVNTDVPPAGVTVLTWPIADSIKNPALSASSLGLASVGQLSSVALAPAASAGATIAAPLYTVGTVPFAPEAAPTINAGPNCDDCLWVGNPIGFTFVFYGNSYDKINIGSNGIVGFGVNTMRDGCCSGSPIPLNDINNNMIALGQSDWMPNAVAKAIRYETRGVAPNRRFVLQFTNVPEYGGNGRMTIQLVLSEGSNDITIYTSRLSTTVPGRVFTQGAENLVGTEAAFVPNRVRRVFALADDAVRYTPVNPNRAPSVVAPANISVNTDPGVCAASVAVGTGTASDDAAGVSLSATRSDGLALDAPYPKGVTTVTWTATDAEKLTSNAAQTVTVTDVEKPSITAPADVTVEADAGLSTSSVSAGTAVAADNCASITLVGSRSDYLTLGEPYRVGVTTIVWTAVDASFNNATAQQTVTVRDNQAPNVVVPASFAVNATMPAGAIVSYSTSHSDNLAVVSFSCDRASGTVFPMGASVVSCTAVDGSGNSTTRSFTVTVLDGPQQIVNLLEFIRGMQIPEPRRSNLVDALERPFASPRGTALACPFLDSFIELVRTSTPAYIPADKSAQVIIDATRIRDVLGCPVT